MTSTIVRGQRLRQSVVLGLWIALVPSFVGSEQLIARRITKQTANSDLFSGTDPIGGVGDWYLSNGIVEAIVDDVGFQVDVFQKTGKFLPIRNFGFTGGAIVDLGLVGKDNDQLNWLAQAVDDENKPILYIPASFVFGDGSLPSVLASVDEEAGVAKLSVYGFVLLSPEPANGQVRVRTDYEVREGDAFLTIRTEVVNDTPGPADIRTVSDVFSLGVGGLLSFSPAPARGFDLTDRNTLMPFASVLGRVRPDHGVVDSVSMRPAGEASYTVYSPDERLLLAEADPFLLNVGKELAPAPLASGSTLHYERRIVVGERNDVASSSALALAETALDYGVTMGEVRARLVVSDGFDFRASAELVLLDLDETTPEPDTFLSALGEAGPVPLIHWEVDSDDDGEFQALVPSGSYELRIRAGERGVYGPFDVSVSPGGIVDLGDIPLASLAKLDVVVREQGPSDVGIPAKIIISGINGSLNPSFGDSIRVGGLGLSMVESSNQSIPGGNITYTVDGRSEVLLRPGDYRVFAARGLEYSIDSDDVSLAAGDQSAVELRLAKVIDTSGFVSADFHVHAALSPDSSVPPVDRIVNFAAEGVQVIVASDHNAIFDYQPIIESLGLSSSMVGIVGVEASLGPPAPGLVSRGHWNAWPHALFPLARRNGAPEEGFVEPNVVYDRLRQNGASVIQLNHASREAIGYLWLQAFDPARPVDHPTNAFLLRESALGTGTRNIDFDAIEIFNGGSSWRELIDTRDAWFSLLNQGLYKAGTAVTDTHTVVLRRGGYPRTFVAMDGNVSDMREFDEARFNENLRALRAFGTSGPFLDVRAVSGSASAGFGEMLTMVGPLSLELTVRAPCWIPVEEVRVYANGVIQTRIPVEATCNGVVRFVDSLELAPSSDTHYIVEAGQAVPRGLDEEPKLPEGPMSVIEPNAYSLAFSNPIFVDVDRNGVFDPPGLQSR